MLSNIKIVCALEATGLLRKPIERRYSVHPFHANRETSERFSIFYNDIRKYEVKFFGYYRMSINSFDELLNALRPYITKQVTHWRNPICAEERLTITLRLVGRDFFIFSFNINIIKFYISRLRYSES